MFMSSDAPRPLLVTIIAILYIISALIYIFSGISTVFLGVAIDLGGLGGVVGGTMLIVGIVELIVGIGFFKGWRIIWFLAVIVAIIDIILNLFSLITSWGELTANAGALLGFLIPLIITILILYYLFRPNVKEFFGI